MAYYYSVDYLGNELNYDDLYVIMLAILTSQYDIVTGYDSDDVNEIDDNNINASN